MPRIPAFVSQLLLWSFGKIRRFLTIRFTPAAVIRNPDLVRQVHLLVR